MLPRQLSTLAHLNFAASFRQQVRWTRGAELVEVGGAILCVGATPFPIGPFNGVVCESADSGEADVLDRAEATFWRLGRGFSVYVRERGDAALESACRARSYLSCGQLVTMAFNPGAARLSPGPGVELETVSDAAGVRRFVAVASQSFASADLPGHVTRSAFSAPERLLSPELRLLVAWHEGRPAACALAISSHHVTGIYWVGTLPRARGRGLAGACVSALAHSALRDGARSVMLQAARHLAGWYERTGFFRVSELSCYCALAPRRRLHDRALESSTRRAPEPLGSSLCWNENHVIS